MRNNKIKALMTYTAMSVYKDDIEALGYELDVVNLRKDKDTLDYDKYEVLISYDAFSKIDVTKMSNLKLIVLSSIGIDQVPSVFFESDNEVMITHNHGGYSIAIGEWVVMTLLMGFKNIHSIYEDNKNRRWKMYMNLRELTGKKIVFLGTGTLSENAALRLKPFGVTRVGMNRKGDSKPYFDKVVSSDNIMSELKDADAVVSCLPKTSATNNFIDYEKLSSMKDDAVFINVSRGSVVDEEALLRVLDEGKFSFVALDVFKQEPLDSKSRFYDYDRVFVSSHNSWVSEERDDRRYEYFYSVLKSYANGETPINLVDKKRGY